MKKKYLFIFIIAFIICAAWNIIADTPKTAQPASASKTEQHSFVSLPDTGITEKLYPYLHFHAAMEEHRKKFPCMSPALPCPKV